MPSWEKKTTISTTTKTISGMNHAVQSTSTTTTVYSRIDDFKAETVKDLLDRFVDIRFKADPFSCAQFGVRRHEDKVFDTSKEGLESVIAELKALDAAVKAFDKPLSDEDAVDLAFLEDAIGSFLRFVGTPGEEGFYLELQDSHMTSTFVYLEMMFGQYQRTETKEDMENFKKRLYLLEPQFDHLIDNYRRGIKRGITLNKEGIEILIQTFETNSGGVDLDDATAFAAKSPIATLEKAKELTGDEHFLVPAIRDVILPGYAKVAKFLKEEYLPHARAHPGLYGLPNYEEEYAKHIQMHTNVAYTAAEIHEIGLAEVARIESLLEKTKTELGFSGSLNEFQQAINDREKYPQLFYENIDDVVPDYAKICEAAKVKMADYFDKFPKFDCTVKAVPSYMEKGAPLAFYMPGTPLKAGEFCANLLLHKTKPAHQKTALCLHEANPGHHHQVSLANENENLHLARRLEMSTSYVEGWGLYCEYLGEEMGFYSDPYQYFGRLELEQFRAIRLVVDSGLHAKGWSVEQAVEYMLSKVSMSRAEIESEVKRYCAMPGQALSYKIGEFKIKELRKYAEDQLGDKFDIKKFHGQLIDFGSMPLGALEKTVKKWVESVKA